MIIPSPFKDNIVFLCNTHQGLVFKETESALSENDKIYLKMITSQKRKNDFLTGRYLAKIALERLGMSNTYIDRNTDGSPIWPKDITGSISHSSELVAVALGRKSSYMSIGLDIQLISDIDDLSIINRVCLKEEQNWINKTLDKHRRLAQIFSAKEALYKTAHPTLKCPLSFQDIELSPISDYEFRISFLNPKLQLNEFDLNKITINTILTDNFSIAGISISI